MIQTFLEAVKKFIHIGWWVIIIETLFVATPLFEFLHQRKIAETRHSSALLAEYQNKKEYQERQPQ